jgi:FG-GAP repeat/FG-GAP-like repeat
VWEASTANTSGAITYELQLSADPKLEVDVTTVTTTEPSHQPAAALPVSTVPPVGRRYYWRVRSCLATSCSEFSPTWWVNLGRSSKDFNGDGYADLAVGESGFPNGGRAQVFFGGPGSTFDITNDGYIPNPGTGMQFGRRVASGRDFNGDGFADLMIGAVGSAYVFFGQAGARLASPRYLALAGGLNEGFGETIAAAGDLNGDGLSDLAVGAPNSSSLGVNTGRVYIYLGGSLGSPSEMLDGARANEMFGSYVSGGDMNGDGLAELLVTAGGFSDDFHSAPCAAYLFWGDRAEKLATKQALTLVGESTKVCSFRAIIAGDLDGDGFADAVAAINPTPVNLMIFSGGHQVSAEAKFVEKLGSGSGFTGSMIPAGDVNGDGFDDVGFGGEQGGNLYLGKGGPGIPLFEATGGVVMDQTPAPAGDVNGDGFDDIVTRGNPVPLYFGAAGASFNTAPDALLSTFASGTGFGDVVAIAPPRSR